MQVYRSAEVLLQEMLDLRRMVDRVTDPATLTLDSPVLHALRSRFRMPDVSLHAPGRPYHLSGLSMQLEQNGNAAFRRTKPELVVPIPVAAAQEKPSTIARCVGVWADQMRRSGVPIWVVLWLNTPPRREADLHRTEQTVRFLQDQYSYLPITYDTLAYPADAAIVQIRQGAYGATVACLDNRGLDYAKIGLLCSDVDLHKATRNYLLNTRGAMAAGAHYVQGRLSYARVPHLPNMNRVMFYYDALYQFNTLCRSSGQTIRIGDFLGVNGFDISRRMGGENELIARLEGAWGSDFRSVRIPDRMVSDPRRAYCQMKGGTPPTRMWGDDFGPCDAYRGVALEELQDITAQQADRLIEEVTAFTGRYGSGESASMNLLWSRLSAKLRGGERFSQQADPFWYRQDAELRAELAEVEHFVQRVLHTARIVEAASWRLAA
jgi:hypothetical protein